VIEGFRWSLTGHGDVHGYSAGIGGSGASGLAHWNGILSEDGDDGRGCGLIR
jgi:hypothetical protein